MKAINNGKKKDWNPTPVDKQYEAIMEGVNYQSGNIELEKQLKLLQATLLIKPHVYYALCYSPKKENPQDAQVLILDIVDKLLYIIEYNF